MHQVLAFFLGLCSGFIGALSTGGGLISIPGLIFLGLPPSTAIATTRLNVITGGIFSLYKYNKAGVTRWKQTYRFIPLAVLGGVLGSLILLQINEHVLERAVGILLLFLAPILFFSKDFGLKEVERSKARRRFGILAMVLVTTYNAFFGGGGGTFLVYTFIYFYGMTVIEANTSGILLGMFTAATSLLVFVPAGTVNFSYGVPMMFGAMLGGYFGARTAIEKGNQFVRLAFLAIVIASSLKLIF